MLHFNNNLLGFEGWEEGAFLILVVRKGNEVLSVKKEKENIISILLLGFFLLLDVPRRMHYALRITELIYKEMLCICAGGTRRSP